VRTEPYRVPPGTDVRLADLPTDDADEYDGDKGAAKEELEACNQRLAELQQLLYADGRHKLLVVLQGMDTAGKDGTIKHVFRHVNPLGVHVANFKKPTEVELAHDYLWRVHAHTPASGHITIFNRSHYEDVLIVRVRGLVPTERIEPRYGHIVDFERLLVDEGTVVVKFFLHISHDEQRERLQERVDNPAKRWKFEHGDVDERELWDDYQRAYELAIGRTSTEGAPWYVVPADKKWFRNLVVSKVLIETLEAMDLAYPEPPDVAGMTII
jgi:PPK2 family polyphosphate:nucleotide phosphotransferase